MAESIKYDDQVLATTRLLQKIARAKKARGMPQVHKSLPSKHEALTAAKKTP
jgi:hypothetical protein